MVTCSPDSDAADAGCEEQNHALTGVITVLAVKIARMEAEIQEKDDIIEKMREDQERNTCPQEEGAGENVSSIIRQKWRTRSTIDHFKVQGAAAANKNVKSACVYAHSVSHFL